MSIKISELPVASTIGDNDIIPIVQESTTKSIKYEKFKPTIETTINSSSTNDNPVGAKAVYDYSAPIDHASENTTYGQGTETKYGHCKTINNVTSASYVAGESLSAYQGKVLKGEIDTLTTNLQEYENTTVPELLNAKEDKSNKTNTLDENSTETQYPNAQVTFEKYNELLNQIPTNEVSGNPINVQDSSNLPIKDFALLGNATQQTYTGKNLAGPISGTLTYGGLTITASSEEIKVTGTLDRDSTFSFLGTLQRTSDYWQTLQMSTSIGILLPAGTYQLSYTSSVNLIARYGDIGTQIQNCTNVGNGANFTISEPKYFCILYYKGATSTAVNVTMSKIQLESGTSTTSFEPYTGGKASPNPDYPQDIHVVTRR